MSNKYKNFIALDVETTGLNDDSEIIEIGLVVVENGEIIREWQSLVKPQKPIPKDISIMTGITPSMVKDAPRWADIEDELLSIIKGKMLLAHNFAFDKGRIEFQLGRTLENNWLDTHDMAKLFLPTLTSYKLMSIAFHLHILDSAHHRALNDATVCAQVFLTLMQQALHADPFTLEEMANTYSGMQESLFDSGYNLGDLLHLLAQEAQATDIAPLDFADFNDNYSDEESTPLLDFNHAADFFAPKGLLSQSKPDYQYRSQQTDMLNCIKQAFVEKKHALIEAGTGTGKSFAYLVPCSGVLKPTNA